MNSKFATVWISILVVLSALWGCNKRLPFEAILTDDTDWTPSITRLQAGYQRFEIGIERPTRKELLRNILSYAVQIRNGQTISYVALDTIQGSDILPGYLLGEGFTMYPYDSKPGLQSNVQYTVRVCINYRTGVSHYSNELSFTIPPVSGRILKRISIPSSVYDFGFTYFAFHKGDLIIGGIYRQLVKIDTATGQSTVLKSEFRPPYGAHQGFFQSFAVIGDSLLTFYEDRNYHFFLVSVDFNTLRVDSSVKIGFSDKSLMTLVASASSLYSLWLHNGNQQFAVIDRASGSIIQALPEVRWQLDSWQDMASDGTGFWISAPNSFNSRLVRFDPTTLSTLEQYDNPVFSPQGLAWDGTHFWVIDTETQTVAKLQLSSK